MVIPEASTVDEYQVSKFPQIEPRGYCYFPFQENPEIAAQSGGTFWSILNYVYPVVGEAESATVFPLPRSGQREVTIPLYELICEQIILVADRFGSIPHSYPELFDTASIYTHKLSASDLQLEQSVLNIFDAYQHEEFDADIAYDFTNTLDRVIRDNGKPVIRIINHLIRKFDLKKEIISETLKALGRIEDENTEEERYQLLMGLIKDESAIVRDGAVSGLSFLDDRRALAQLRMLFATETVPILKNNIKVAIKGLETY